MTTSLQMELSQLFTLEKNMKCNQPRIRGIDLLSALAQLRRGAVAGPLLRAVDLAIDALRTHRQVPHWESSGFALEGSE